MAKVIKSKKVSYGTIELRENDSENPRYTIYVNGKLREYSNSKAVLEEIFDKKYY